MSRTRLAPSPTGALHLGNARTFLVNFLLARQLNIPIHCRIEDIDGPRVKPDADRQALNDLAFLGIGFDSGPVYQSHNLARYQRAARQLLDAGLAYPCVCSRSEVEVAAAAPHASDGATVYPGTCRGRHGSIEEAETSSGRKACLRFRLPSKLFRFRDLFAEAVEFDTDALGDFPILKADGTPSYQLAAAVDDAESGVTLVVRGDDLLDSVPRQVLLLRALGLRDDIEYCHLPLVIGGDGRRLAKRHGDTRIDAYRAAGASAGRILRLLARWCGIVLPVDAPIRTAADLLPHFELARLPRSPIIFTPDDDLFLRRP
jgi:glutamyl-tRNA synthetase